MNQQDWLQSDNTKVGERITPSNPNFSLELISAVTPEIVTDVPVTLFVAQAAQARYITDLLVTNGSATVGSWVTICQGTTVIYQGYAAAAGGGFVVAFKTPLRFEINTDVKVHVLTDGSDIVVSASGYNAL
jgi:hypothetical protein